jgi:hypothetical protein
MSDDVVMRCRSASHSLGRIYRRARQTRFARRKISSAPARSRMKKSAAKNGRCYRINHLYNTSQAPKRRIYQKHPTPIPVENTTFSSEPIYKMSQFSILGMAKHFAMIQANVEAAEHRALDRASKLILDECKKEIGNYQSAAGPFAGWAPLKPETISRKANGDTPLLETGEMRDSYERVVGKGEAHVGSNNKKALYHELGPQKFRRAQ